jgi:hypothetical protein
MTKYADDTHNLAARILSSDASMVAALATVLREIRKIVQLTNPLRRGLSVKRARKSGSVQIRKTKQKLEVSLPLVSAGDSSPERPLRATRKTSELVAPRGKNSQVRTPRRKSKSAPSSRSSSTRTVVPTVSPGPTPTRDGSLTVASRKSARSPVIAQANSGRKPSLNKKEPASRPASQSLSRGKGKGTSVPKLSPSPIQEVKNKGVTQAKSLKRPSKGTDAAIKPRLPTPGPKVPEFLCTCSTWVTSKYSAQTPGRHTVLADCQRWRSKVGKHWSAMHSTKPTHLQDKIRDQAAPDKAVTASGVIDDPAMSSVGSLSPRITEVSGRRGFILPHSPDDGPRPPSMFQRNSRSQRSVDPFDQNNLDIYSR